MLIKTNKFLIIPYFLMDIPTDKEIKKEFKLKASKEPDKYYATSVLKSEGFGRNKCSKCGTYFWSTTNSGVCGNPACSGGFRFIGDTPATKKLDYVGVWIVKNVIFYVPNFPDGKEVIFENNGILIAKNKNELLKHLAL